MAMKNMISIIMLIFLFIFALESTAKPPIKVFCVSDINSSVCQNYNYSEYQALAYYMNHSSKYFKTQELTYFNLENTLPLT